MSGRVKHLLLGKKDPTAHHEDKKRNKELEPPLSPRSPLSPGFHLKPFKDILSSAVPSISHRHPPASISHCLPKKSSSQQSLPSTCKKAHSLTSQTPPPSMPIAVRKIDSDNPMEERKFRQRSASKTSTTNTSTSCGGTESPPEMMRPSYSSSHQEGHHFMHRVKASRQAATTYGGKAAKITAKATSSTAKLIGEKGSKTWGKIKEKAKSSKESTPIVPQSQYLGNFKPKRSKKNPIDVWGMSLQEATTKTRVINEILCEADSAAYWTPAIAFRCLQYVTHHFW